MLNLKKLLTKILTQLNCRFISTADTTTLIETVLSLDVGDGVVVRFSGDAGTTLVGSSSQHLGVAVKADSAVVDIFCGSYASGKAVAVRATKTSVGNYTVARKSVTLS